MLIGADEVIRNLEKQMKIIAKTKEQGLIEIGERGVGILKLNTPVKDGRLRNSMSYTTNSKSVDPLGANNPQDKLRALSSKSEVIIGTNVIYAPKVEYLATNGSAGYMLRSYKQLKPQAEQIFQKLFKNRGF